MIRKSVLMALALAGFCAFADDGYGVADGYIQITENLESFGFTVSEGSTSSGGIGYYTYSAADRSDMKDMGLVDLSSDKALDLGATEAGTKVGFYFEGGISRVYDYTLTPNGKGGYQVEFKMERTWHLGSYTNSKGNREWGVYYTYEATTKDRIISLVSSIEKDSFVISGISGERPMTGMPLPGFLIALMLGSLGAGGVAARRRNKKA